MKKHSKAWGVLIDGDQVFIVYRSQYDDYSLPKGHREKWEKLEETAIREVLEETWCKWEILWLLEKVEYSYEVTDIIHECEVSFYLMKLKKIWEKVVIDDVDKVMKMPFNEAMKKLSYDTDRRVLQKAIEKLWINIKRN